jgi:hypothetical protein
MLTHANRPPISALIGVHQGSSLSLLGELTQYSRTLIVWEMEVHFTPEQKAQEKNRFSAAVRECIA